MENRESFFCYKVYGLFVKSEIELTELCRAETCGRQETLVNISYGAMPDEINECMAHKKYYQFGKQDTWFAVPDIGIFRIREGCEITVQKEPEADFKVLKAYLLGSAFGVLFAQRNIVAIHGSTIVVNGQAVILTGTSGAGKSTLTTAFRKAGAAFLADDVSATRRNDEGEVVALPAYPQQKLCRDVMDHMGYDIKQFVQIDEGRDKYILPVREQFVDNPMKLTAIVELNVGEVEKVQIIEIKGREKLGKLMRNIYRLSAVTQTGLETVYFKQCMNILGQIKFYELTRPESAYTVDEEINYITEAVGKA